MAVFDESKVINALHPEKAEVGKKYWFADNIVQLKGFVVGCDDGKPIVLTKVLETPSCQWPFEAENSYTYSFLYPYEEPLNNLMTNEQLAEWLTKGNGKVSTLNWDYAYTSHVYNKACSNDKVPKDYLICPWGTDEWIEPTIDIYERDCKGE